MWEKMRLQTSYRAALGALMLALLVVGSGIAATQRTLVAPTITDFTPKTGQQGTHVVITGTGFAGAKVAFFAEGVAAAAVVVNTAGTSITATVPAPPEEGPQPIPSPIIVTTPGGTANSSASFAYVIPTKQVQPVVASITPTRPRSSSELGRLFTSRKGRDTTSHEQRLFAPELASSVSASGLRGGRRNGRRPTVARSRKAD
jgi:hypothetical protein